MAGILNTIGEHLGRWKPQEKKLALFILDHPQQVVQMGVTELAAASQTSPATVSRFCRRIHFRNYAEFKMKLAAELARSPQNRPYQDIVAGQDLPRIVEAIEANHLRSITDTTRLLDYKQLQAAVNVLSEAERIDIYGMGTSGIVAQDLCQKLVRVGKVAFAHADPHMQLTSASALGPADAIVAISHSGETRETMEALSCAKEQGAASVSITRFGTGKIAELADIPLFITSLEEGMRRGDMASRIAQLHMVDILFTAMVSEHFAEFVPRLEHTYRQVRKFRKEKGEQSDEHPHFS